MVARSSWAVECSRDLRVVIEELQCNTSVMTIMIVMRKLAVMKDVHMRGGQHDIGCFVTLPITTSAVPRRGAAVNATHLRCA